MAFPISERTSLFQQGTVLDADCGFVVVWTIDGQTHLFEASDGTLVQSPTLSGKWVLRRP